MGDWSESLIQLDYNTGIKGNLVKINPQDED